MKAQTDIPIKSEANECERSKPEESAAPASVPDPQAD